MAHMRTICQVRACRFVSRFICYLQFRRVEEKKKTSITARKYCDKSLKLSACPRARGRDDEDKQYA